MLRCARMAGTRPLPSISVEASYWRSGCTVVAGVDEVGRGPLAGPVFTAAVVLNPRKRPGWLKEVRDSKVLPAKDRERLAEVIRLEALDFAVGWASVAEIDAWGIGLANKMAMIRAIDGLKRRPGVVLIDGPIGVKHPVPQRTIVDGDATCCTIAAASIVAKVARDAVMCHLDVIYPGYGFAAHKGYATRDHLESIARQGMSEQHRRSWLAVQRKAAEGEVASVLASATVESQELVDAAR